MSKETLTADQRTLGDKVMRDDVYSITLEELIEFWGLQHYSPIGQATLNHLEKLQRSLRNAL